MLIAPGCSRNAAPPEGQALNGEPRVVTLLKDPAMVGDFTIADLDGKTITSGALRGKVVFVNFWATWCPPCRQEIPDLIKLQNTYKDDVIVLGISEDEAPADTVRAFAAEHGMNYFIAMKTPELGKVFRGVAALPTTFVLDRDGKIVQKHVGLLDPERTELEAQVLTGKNTTVRIERTDDPDKLRLQNAAQATSVPGVDLTMLSPAQRTAAIQALNAEDCTCGCTLTLAECRINDPECQISLPLAKEKVRQIAAAAGATQH
jgi:thiol-disulfide isomerase/thioredoxin